MYRYPIIEGTFTEVTTQIANLATKYIRNWAGDVVEDMQFFAEEYYTKEDSILVWYWSVGKNGTHLISISDTEKCEAVERNYPENEYFTLVFKR